MPPPAIFAFYAGRDVPAPVRAQIAAAAQKGLDSDAQAAERLRKLGLTHAISGPSLLETVQVEANLLRKTISDANIAIER